MSQAVEARRDALAAASGGGGGGLRMLCGGASAVCRRRGAGDAYDVEALRQALSREAVGEGCPYRLEHVPAAYARLRERVEQEAQIRPWLTWEQYLEVRPRPVPNPLTSPAHPAEATTSNALEPWAIAPLPPASPLLTHKPPTMRVTGAAAAARASAAG